MSTIVNATAQRCWVSLTVARPLRLVAAWPAAVGAWRNRIQVLAITPSAPFKKDHPATAANTKISVDPFHLVSWRVSC
ncbi:MAG TPA: hypothetical protein VI094_08200 [Propionibacteriaceae bacterium]